MPLRAWACKLRAFKDSYGPGDNYHPTNSHMLPVLLRRFHEPAEAYAPSVACWGTGTPQREFLNVGTGLDLTIRELAEAVAAATGYHGEIHWDASKPDGTPKKQLDVSRLAALGWQARIPLAEGLSSTVVLYRQALAQQLVRL